MSPLRWVFLDAGSTLVHIDFEFLVQALARHGVPTTTETLRAVELNGRGLVDTPALVDRTNDRERWDVYFNFITGQAGLADPAQSRRISAELRRRQTEKNLWRIPDPEAPAVLDALRRAGYRLACISNSDGSVRRVLQEAGLAQFLEFVVDSHEVGIEKPDPRIFLDALAQAGAAPQEAAYVGDVFHVDVIGARAAGMTPIFLDPVGRLPGENVLRIKSLGDLPECLQKPNS